MDNEQLIQKYYTNRLSEKEKASLELKIKTDADFKSEFESHRDIAMAFKLSEAQNLKTHFQQLEKSSAMQKPIFKRLKYFYLAIASIVILGFFYTTYNKQSGKELFNSNFEIFPNTYQPVTRSSETNKKNKAFVAYENGDFATSEKEFKSILETSENLNIRFYYASSLLNQSKFDLALIQFKLLNTKNHDYMEESIWFSALIQIKKENYSKAKENLNQLNTLKSVFKSEERKLLLLKLKDD